MVHVYKCTCKFFNKLNFSFKLTHHDEYTLHCRRQYIQEQLDKVKIRLGQDPRGLTYRAGDPSPEPFSDDGTTIVKNPLSHGRNFTYHPDDLPDELPGDLNGQDMDDIHIGTVNLDTMATYFKILSVYLSHFSNTKTLSKRLPERDIELIL